MQDSSIDWNVYFKNLPKADALQEKYCLTETLKDLYAWERLVENEAIKLQEYLDRTYPKYTGDNETDLKLMEDFEKVVVAWKISEDELTDHKAKDLYLGCFLELDEALELQRIRTKN